VDLGFADFSTLARRRRCCALELALNRRLAPGLYRDVVAITGTRAAPRIGGPGRALEYAVQMVQFPQHLLAAAQLEAGRLAPPHFDALARDVAAFHRRARRATALVPRGVPAAAHAAVRETFTQLRALPGLARRALLARLERWSEARFVALAPELGERRRDGRVRECHGDLHLGNLVLLDERLVMFDCIEFNPALRWIDTASEVAFTVMDLHRRGAARLARRFLSAWLEASGDYGALRVLDYFLVYRALVRAKVAAIRAAQCGPGTPARAAALEGSREYLGLALGFTRRRRPQLVITHGVSGSGKSTAAQALVEGEGLVRVRSDVERKRLHGLPPLARSGAAPGAGPYGAAATARTYALLERRAAEILDAGYGVVVDATFLRRDQRARFAALARRRRCPFRILACAAPREVLRRRIGARHGDPSEATAAVLDAQLRAVEAPDAAESAALMHVNAPAARRPTLKPPVLTRSTP
jgi:aminoglycoside phosphotransferase family enzyme/predicted kinase